MNRPLKFRVWDNELKKFGNPDQYGLILRYGLIHGKEKHPEYDIYYNPNVIIQQYTGLTDSKGKEIYEGDILLEYIANETQTKLGICKEILGGWKIFSYPDSSICWGGWKQEVVGNIFENKELLK